MNEGFNDIRVFDQIILDQIIELLFCCILKHFQIIRVLLLPIVT